MQSQRSGRQLSAADRALWARQVFVSSLVIWLALDGLARLPVGLVVAGAAGLLAGALAVGRAYSVRPRGLLAFAWLFLWGSFRGGVDVAWRALHPALPLSPRFVRYTHGLPRGQPRTLLVSVLSLMPGTLSADLEDDGDTVIVHVLTDEAAAALDPLRDRIADLFGARSTGT
jgi:multicomponent Na+:H+ antiporter subunit E